MVTTVSADCGVGLCPDWGRLRRSFPLTLYGASDFPPCSFMGPEMACLFPSPQSGVLYVSLHLYCLSKIYCRCLVCPCSSHESGDKCVQVFYLVVLSLLSVASILWKFLLDRRTITSVFNIKFIYHLAWEWRGDINLLLFLVIRKTAQENSFIQEFPLRCESEI